MEFAKDYLPLITCIALLLQIIIVFRQMKIMDKQAKIADEQNKNNMSIQTARLDITIYPQFHGDCIYSQIINYSLTPAQNLKLFFDYELIDGENVDAMILDVHNKRFIPRNTKRLDSLSELMKSLSQRMPLKPVDLEKIKTISIENEELSSTEKKKFIGLLIRGAMKYTDIFGKDHYKFTLSMAKITPVGDLPSNIVVDLLTLTEEQKAVLLQDLNQ